MEPSTIVSEELQRQATLGKARQIIAAEHAVDQMRLQIERLRSQVPALQDAIALAKRMQPLADQLPADCAGDARAKVQGGLGAVIADRSQKLRSIDDQLTGIKDANPAYCSIGLETLLQRLEAKWQSLTA